MRKSFSIAIASAFLAPGVRPNESSSRIESQAVRNGTILEITDGFPYPTYERWLQQG